MVSCGTGVDYNGGALPAWNSATITIQTGLTTDMVDNFLIYQATNYTHSGAKTWNLAGTNQAASATSAAAHTKLESEGKTITVN